MDLQSYHPHLPSASGSTEVGLFKITNPLNNQEVSWIVKNKVTNGVSVTEIVLQNVGNLTDDQIKTLVSQAIESSAFLSLCASTQNNFSNLQFRQIRRVGNAATVSMS